MKTKIMIVEDDGTIALHLAWLLNKWEYQPVSASKGEKALELAETERPELALMDIFLGEGQPDGIAVAEILRDRYDIPTIFLTAHTDGELLERAKQTGPYGYLVKPIQELALFAMIEMAISKRKTDKRLRESEERLRIALDAVNSGIWWLNVQTKEIGIDDKFRELLGFAKNEFPPCLEESLHHPEDWPVLVEKVDQLLQGKTTAYANEHRVLTKNGEWMWVHAWGKISKWDENGAPVVLTGVAIDISDRKSAENRQQQFEEQLRQSQKMEAVGQLAGGIAHDFNNMMHVIMGYSEMMKEDIPENHPCQHNIHEILATVDRAKKLVRQLLQFSRKEAMQPVYLDLNALIRNLTKMLRRIIGEHIELVVDPAPELKTVYADPGQIEQVIMNLCLNARDAMPDGGTITIKTDNASAESSFFEKAQQPPLGEYVCLTISDTGKGMTPEIMEKVFEPFFTTKEVGKGTGLGLAAAYGIVTSHGGLIHVCSKPGMGSEFKTYLPFSNGQTHRIQKHPKAKPPTAGKEMILVAEDEQHVRELTVRILEKAGYRVMPASDGEEALRIVDQHCHDIDLALLDVIMPKIGGKVVCERIRKIRPDMPVVFITGHNEDLLLSDIASDSHADIIGKPIGRDALLRKIRERLDRKRK